jgi:hypothetical protein
LDFQFALDRDKCMASDLVQAMAKAYEGYTYDQDRATGVIWLHPQTVAYQSILSAKIRITRSSAAVPMLAGILQPLTAFPSLAFGLNGRILFHLGDYPVDLTEGVYSVRDVINMCCVASPYNTFYISLLHSGVSQVWPLAAVPFDPRRLQRPSAGALAYWRMEVDLSGASPPTAEMLIDALANGSARTRSAAQNYLGLAPSAVTEGLAGEAASTEKAIWTAIGVERVLAPGESRGFPFAVEPLKKAIEQGSAISPGLRALAAAEVARAGGGVALLEYAARQPLSAVELAPVRLDMIRILRCSEPVRKSLAALSPPWAGFSKQEIEALGRLDYFSLP